MKFAVWTSIVVLLVLHQDYWQWDNATLVFGFLPHTLFYHLGISLAAAVLWALATKFCWSEEIESVDATSASKEDLK